MEQEENIEQPQNHYLVVTIFLIILLVVGGIFLLTNKNNKNQVLQTEAQSANIETIVEPATTPVATVSGVKTMDKVTELQIVDEKIGTGDEAVVGKTITVNYAGKLTDGTEFDSSYGRGTPFSFKLGAGQVIEGWDKGFAGMKVGGKRKLTIPSSMAYGDDGIPGAIPGGATLIFEVELLQVN